MNNLIGWMRRGLGRAATGLTCAASVMVLAGCTHTVPADIKFDAANPKALVVIGLEGLDHWQGRSFSLSFRGIDASGKIDGRSFTVSNGDGWVERNPTEYYVVEIEPGAYILDMASTDTGLRITYARYCEGTSKFEALAGKAAYVGNFAAPAGPGAAAHLAKPHFDAATAKLLQYSQIRQTLEQTEMRPVPYPKGSYCDR